MARANTQIKTYTGIYFNPLEIKQEHIAIEDIAHSLSLQCRGGGHIKHFFSVAQHSINCSLEASNRGYSKRVQLACLLHDASEAYISDITSPVKRQLSQYIEIEKMIQDQVWSAYFKEPLNQSEFEKVDLIDELMLYHELYHLLQEEITISNTLLEIRLNLETKNFKDVEMEFIEIFKELVK